MGQKTVPLPAVLSKHVPPAHPAPIGNGNNDSHVPGGVTHQEQAFASDVYTPNATTRRQSPAPLSRLESRLDFSNIRLLLTEMVRVLCGSTLSLQVHAKLLDDSRNCDLVRDVSWAVRKDLEAVFNDPSLFGGRQLQG